MFNQTKAFCSAVFLTALILIVPTTGHAMAWQEDYEQGLKSAHADGKPVLLDFTAVWCGWCKKLEKDVYSETAFTDAAENYVCLKIDADKRRDLMEKYSVHGLPTLVLLNSEGQELERLSGYMQGKTLSDVMKKHAKQSGGRDPLGQAPTLPPVDANPPPPAVKKDPFVLSGISVDQKSSVAIVNNVLVRVGDTVSGAKILSIEKDKVRLSSDGKEITLSL